MTEYASRRPLLSDPKCVWRTGCSHTERCREAGHCTAPTLATREADLFLSKEQLISRVKAARDRKEISLELSMDICEALGTSGETPDARDAERYRYLRERVPFDRLIVRRIRINDHGTSIYEALQGAELDREIDECTGASEKAREQANTPEPVCCACGVMTLWPGQHEGCTAPMASPEQYNWTLK